MTHCVCIHCNTQYTQKEFQKTYIIYRSIVKVGRYYMSKSNTVCYGARITNTHESRTVNNIIITRNQSPTYNKGTKSRVPGEVAGTMLTL